MRSLLFVTALLAACGDKDPDTGTDTGTDADGDGWSDGEDCDDDNAAIHPDADEVCDGVDNNCDGEIDGDDAVDRGTFYADADGDQHGDAGHPTTSCTQPDGTVSDSGDCDDGNAAVHPDAGEVCDGIDNNCDDSIDENVTTVYYTDADGDGHGDTDATTEACEQPRDHVDVGGDCDDSDASRWPGAPEVCGDGVRNDCDGGGGAFDACGISGSTSLSSSWAVLRGETDGDYAGTTVSGAGDVNGDGLADILVGAGASGPGRAYLLLGNISGDVSLSGAHATLLGEDDNDHAGEAVASAGDINGDGLDDVIIGALADDNAGSASGSAYLVLGGVSGATSLSGAYAHLTGEAREDYAGSSVSGAGDIDGDGLDDVIIGAFNSDAGATSAGSAYLVLGGVSGTASLSDAHAQLTGEGYDDNAGGAVSGAGDVDGDGLGDVVIGAYRDDDGGDGSGSAYLVLGGVSGIHSLSSAHAQLTGESTYDRAGFSVSGAGDVDGDGHDDLLIGAPGEETGGYYAGSVYLVLGGVSGAHSLSSAHAKLSGEAGDDEAGHAVSGAGDVDGDGLGDLLIGARGDDDGGSTSGGAYLVLGGVSGAHSLSSAHAQLTGEAAGDAAGYAVSGAGDVDGDGLGDLLIGAPQFYGTSTAGTAYVVLSVSY